MDFDLLRGVSQGTVSEEDYRAITESASYDDDTYDQEIIQECVALCLGLTVQDTLLENAFDYDERIIDETIAEVLPFLAGQEIISEAAAVSMTNPKKTYVKFSKEAQMKRIKSIIILKLARKDKFKPYDKFKIAIALKKKNMQEMVKRYGAKAERLSKEVYRQTLKGGKVQAVSSSKKKK